MQQPADAVGGAVLVGGGRVDSACRNNLFFALAGFPIVGAPLFLSVVGTTPVHVAVATTTAPLALQHTQHKQQ